MKNGKAGTGERWVDPLRLSYGPVQYCRRVTKYDKKKGARCYRLILAKRVLQHFKADREVAADCENHLRLEPFQVARVVGAGGGNFFLSFIFIFIHCHVKPPDNTRTPDSLWSQGIIPSLPGICLGFLSRIWFISTPAARRSSLNFALLTLLRFLR